MRKGALAVPHFGEMAAPPLFPGAAQAGCAARINRACGSLREMGKLLRLSSSLPTPSQSRQLQRSARCLPASLAQVALELLGLATRAGPRPLNGFPVCFSVDKVSTFSQPSPLGDFPIGTAGAASSLGPALGSVPRAGAGRRFPPAVQVGRVQQKESFSGLPFPSQKRVFGNKNCLGGEQTGEVPGRFRPDAPGRLSGMGAAAPPGLQGPEAEEWLWALCRPRSRVSAWLPHRQKGPLSQLEPGAAQLIAMGETKPARADQPRCGELLAERPLPGLVCELDAQRECGPGQSPPSPQEKLWPLHSQKPWRQHALPVRPGGGSPGSPQGIPASTPQKTVLASAGTPVSHTPEVAGREPRGVFRGPQRGTLWPCCGLKLEREGLHHGCP